MITHDALASLFVSGGFDQPRKLLGRDVPEICCDAQSMASLDRKIANSACV